MWRRRTAALLSTLLLALAPVVAACGTAGPAADPVTVPPLDPPSASSAPTAAPSASAPPAARATRTRRTPAAPPTPSITIPDLPTPEKRGIVEGADASWPQCPKGMGIPQKRGQGKPMPLPTARYVMLGLTNGPAFHANPCLADQVAWVKQHHLLTAAYSVLSLPEKRFVERYAGRGPYDASTRLGRLGNLGYQQALFNVATMRRVGLDTPIVWLDVEPVTHFDWPDDPAGNAAVVKGAARAYADGGFQVGIYSIESLWQQIVGDLRLGLPEWRPAAETSRAEALRRCTADWMFQGGTAAFVQWLDGDRDRDLTCPGTSLYLTLWFHQY